MKLVRFRAKKGGPRIGVLNEDWILDAAILSKPPGNFEDLIRHWDQYGPLLHNALAAVTSTDDWPVHPKIHAFENVEILAPVTQHGIIICVGLNYPTPCAAPDEHLLYPVLFLKDQRTIHPPGKAIVLPSASDRIFCEGELAAVIGQSGKHIPVEKALDYVFGYTIANDVGARDLEQRTSQWATGKLPDTFLPVGPWLVTSSDIADLNQLTISVAINDQPYLEGCCGDMIFSIAELIAYISAIKRLEPGDILVTGSPKGLGDQPAVVQYLKPGDSIAITIDPIGVLTNGVKQEEDGSD